eukprot:CAMPEP_0202798722 /NCGR_PEP_ID=MMETSP1388-20130828/96817_1 /ASSEMBLY_ACC=CAM_ASM_000864 /TAXON_ID=37098 /ORGANISM="Isochrysis sp, Strain CCMP1244" /LENGTH=128 /DNA_ID=CAMNT_0049468653 /DNA_START=286 /DNA_END=672 /DNA_ORIENTATION=+
MPQGSLILAVGATPLPNPREEVATRHELLEQQHLRQVCAPKRPTCAHNMRVIERTEHLDLLPHVFESHLLRLEPLHRNLQAAGAVRRDVHRCKAARTQPAAKPVLALKGSERAGLSLFAPARAPTHGG